MVEPDVKRLKELGEENARLKRLLAERDVEINVMKEFFSKKLPWRERASRAAVKTKDVGESEVWIGIGVRHHIDTGSPWQNECRRNECLNMETFHNQNHTRALIKMYDRHYNQRRPHSVLGYLTPVEFTAEWQIESAGTVSAAASVG